MPDAGSLAHRFDVLGRVLDERRRRFVAVPEAEVLGFGGVTEVAKESGLSSGIEIRALAELKTGPKPACGQRIRQTGVGR